MSCQWKQIIERMHGEGEKKLIEDDNWRLRYLCCFSDKVEACHNEPSSSSAHHLHSQRPLVLCCQDDLCNLSAQQVQLRFNSALRNRNDSSSDAKSSSSSGNQQRYKQADNLFQKGIQIFPTLKPTLFSPIVVFIQRDCDDDLLLTLDQVDESTWILAAESIIH